MGWIEQESKDDILPFLNTSLKPVLVHCQTVLIFIYLLQAGIQFSKIYCRDFWVIKYCISDQNVDVQTISYQKNKVQEFRVNISYLQSSVLCSVAEI